MSRSGSRSSGAERRTGKRRPGPVTGLIRLVAIGAVITALVHELRRPRADRSWHGTVWGFVPYDFRLPNIKRIRDRTWSPDTPELLVPTVFGVGWTVNFGRVIALLRGRSSSLDAGRHTINQ